MSRMAVAVVNYNTRECLRDCLDSVEAVADGAAEVLVADNGSTDGSLEMLRCRYPRVTVHLDESNPGYGGAANAAMQLTSAPYLLLLNSDTIVRAGTLERLEGYLDEHPEAAVASPRILNPGGTRQRSTFPFPHPLRTFLGGFGLESTPFPFSLPGGRGADAWKEDQAVSVPWVLGAAFALRRPAFESVGGFRQDFFMYLEETDLCTRLHDAGWEVHFVPAAEVVHVGGVSTDQVRSEMRIRYCRSLVLYCRLNESELKAAMMYGVLRGGAAVKWIRDRVRLSTASGERERRLKEDLTAWRQVLAGGWLDDGRG